MGAHFVRRAHRIALAFIACGAIALSARAASAEPLTAEETARIERGDVVQRHVTFDAHGARYIGGLGYVLVHAPIDEVREMLLDVRSYRRILPLTLDAREVAHKGDDRWVYLRHGGRLATASYTMLVRAESEQSVRFWLDPTRPHDVDDAWGFFRLEPHGADATLVSYGAAVSLGMGVAELLFEGKIRKYLLETPELVRRTVEDRARSRVRQARL